MNNRVLLIENVCKSFGIMIVLLLAIQPAFNNFKYNNHSKNWLNHDYGKNLLSSTQEYSVFMTEGGDNQVFSSLYFTYAEKLRQDLFPYDQKGNIFKRIYGDLRYVTYDTLQERSVLVNKGLFNGEEPFYVDIRSQKKPYLVPYALGKPSTYLTWKLPNQHELGNVYYKNYGLMNKVQPISLAVVDFVETIGSANLSEIKIYLEEQLGRTIGNIEMQLWIKESINKGYISQNNSTIQFKKSYPKPFSKDPIETFIIRWDDIPNLAHYDYLSREIVISYTFEQINLYSDKINSLQKLSYNNDSKNTSEEIKENINQYWSKIEKYTDVIQKVGYDSAATLHNLGIFYLSAKDEFHHITEDQSPVSMQLWEQALESAPYSWSTYNILLWTYIKLAVNDIENSEEYLYSFDTVLDKMIENMYHWKSMKKNITNAKPYQNVKQLVDTRNDFDQFAGRIFEQNQRDVKVMVDKNSPLNLPLLNNYILKAVNQLNFIDSVDQLELEPIWNQAWQLYKSNPEFFNWHINILSQLADYHMLDTKLFSMTLIEGKRYMKNENTAGSPDIPFFITLLKIAKGSQDIKLITLYKNKLLTVSKNNLPADQYVSFTQQVNQLLEQ